MESEASLDEPAERTILLSRGDLDRNDKAQDLASKARSLSVLIG